MAKLAIDYAELPHRDKCVRPPRINNPLYPLPPDYHLLPEHEQSWWRVNACCVQDTPEDFVIAWTFFFNTYLVPEESGFLENARETPAFHTQIVHDIAAFKLNVFVGPRHCCKSTVIRVIDLLLLLTRRNYRVGNVFSIQTIGRRGISKVRRQLENNQLLIADFGRMSPPRGSSYKWSNEDLELPAPFNSVLWGMWIKGQSRSSHFDWLAIDDAEYDPETESVVPEMTARLEDQVNRVFMPMIEIASADLDNPLIGHRGSGILIAGTIIQENMFLNKAATAPPGGTWDFWNRVKLNLRTAAGKLLWKKRWSADVADLLQEVMGASAYASEMQNAPGSLSDARFRIHPKFNTYSIEQTDDKFAYDPCDSDSLVRWYERQNEADLGTPVEMLVGDWLSTMDRAILIDWADTNRVTETADPSAIHVIGNDGKSCLWSLDLVNERMDSNQAASHVIDLAIKWRVRRIVMESVGMFGKISDMVAQAVHDRLLEVLGYVPVPLRLIYNSRRQSKGARIDRIAWRFVLDRIRFPAHRQSQPPYSDCWHQVNNFTVDLKRLRNDDIVDTLGFCPDVFKGPGGHGALLTGYAGMSVVELIEAGQLYSSDGLPMLSAVPSYSMLSDAAIEALSNAAKNRNPNAPRPPRRICAPGPINRTNLLRR